VATSGDRLAWLHALWQRDADIPGLPLSESDRIQIVCELAVRREDGLRLVEQQLERTRDRERREALAFVAPALSAAAGDRRRFLDTIAAPAGRRREPWVVEGIRWLHHPLRAESSLRFIDPGLQLLEEVKRTGDIFLPKRWLDAMLGGHRSAAAARIVQAFVESRPTGYPHRLTGMVLASADYLFRAVKHSAPQS
jgi:aminopeptidase N